MGAPHGSAADQHDLAQFGYKQELHRDLGRFSSFAAGFSYISILTGMFQLFYFGFGAGGPAFFWTWPLVFAGQMAVALCFAELAGQFPIAGSVYQWSKQIANPATSWMSGWIMVIGAIVTVAAVAVAYQIILPQISPRFQFIGTSADVGLVSTPDGAKNAILLGVFLVVFTTIINMIGVKLMAQINNAGVAAELIGVTLLIILLAFHITRGPQVVFETQGTGAGHDWGYFGAFLIAAIMSAYVMYGFDTAGSLAEETNEPRKFAPKAIIQALIAAGIAGALLMLVGMMAVGNIHAEELSTSGLPYIVKSTLGDTLGNIFLIDVLVAITVCCLAVHTAAIRMAFSMARDNNLPFGSSLARVSGTSKTPIVPAIVVGALAILILVVNVGNQRIFTVVTSIAIVMFYISYMLVTIPMLLRRLRGTWPRPNHGAYFSLGKWGLPVNLFAVVYGFLMAFNLAWPRAYVYGSDHWYFQYGAYVFIGGFVIIGGLYYYFIQRHKSGVLEEHRADLPAPPAPHVVAP